MNPVSIKRIPDGFYDEDRIVKKPRSSAFKDVIDEMHKKKYDDWKSKYGS